MGLRKLLSKEELILLVIVIALFLINISNDGLWFVGDAAVHANDGLLYADYLKNPFRDPIDLATAEYSYYPSLGLVHYMPLFPFTLAVSYILFGSSFISAIFCGLIFSSLQRCPSRIRQTLTVTIDSRATFRTSV